MITLGVITVVKLAGIATSGYMAFAGWGAMAAPRLRRELTALFKAGDMSLKTKRKRGKETYETKKYPTVVATQIKDDRRTAVFQIPVGYDPAEVWKREYLFRQGFGQWVELIERSSKQFTLHVYDEDMKRFVYDLEEAKAATQGMRLPIYVGRDRSGPVAYDMVEHPHLLIAGLTGSGKSVQFRSVLTTLIKLAGDRVVLYCADLKRTEFHLYRGIAQTVDMDAVAFRSTLIKLSKELTRRGELLDAEGVAHVDELPPSKRLPYVVLAVEEFAMLKKDKDALDVIENISAIGRALGVFVILATQRPDADILDGKLKTNLSARMAFRHADVINSRITLDSGEAASIRPDQKGRLVFSLLEKSFIQAPLLDVKPAKELLAPHKAVTPGAGSKKAEEAPLTIDVEEQEPNIWGVL